MAPLSDEEENYIRLALLLKGVSPRAVRTVFDKEFPPTYLPSTLNKNLNTLKSLFKKRILNQAQWNHLFPTNGVPDSNTFDVTLMICLIRNLTSVNCPINGFDKLPLPGETTQGSDLARIKWYRNRLAHHDSNTMPTCDFNTAWRDIANAVNRLGGVQMNQECQDLKVKLLDQSNQEIMLEIKQSQEETKQLRRMMAIENETIRENLRDLEDSQRTLLREHIKVSEFLKDPIPWKMREVHKQEVETWQQDDTNFVETTASKKLLLAISQQDTNVVTVIGPTGSGKSFLIKHAAVKIQVEYGSVIIPVDGLKKVLEWFDPGSEQLFVLDIDKACHSPLTLHHTLKKWQEQSAALQTRFNESSLKLIACCSTDIYEHPEFKKISLLHQNKFDLKADANTFSDKDIETIATKYMKEEEVVALNDMKGDLKKLHNFPMLCRKFSEEKHENPALFFTENLSIISNATEVKSVNTNVEINMTNSLTINPTQTVQGMFVNPTFQGCSMNFNFYNKN